MLNMSFQCALAAQKANRIYGLHPLGHDNTVTHRFPTGIPVYNLHILKILIHRKSYTISTQADHTPPQEASQVQKWLPNLELASSPQLLPWLPILAWAPSSSHTSYTLSKPHTSVETDLREWRALAEGKLLAQLVAKLHQCVLGKSSLPHTLFSVPRGKELRYHRELRLTPKARRVYSPYRVFRVFFPSVIINPFTNSWG